jgi:hypothetical protein
MLAEDDYPVLGLGFLILQKIYVPIIDILITLSIMYLFYKGINTESDYNKLLNGGDPRRTARL